MKHIGTLFSAAVIGLVISTAAAAQAKPEVVVKQRQAAMTLQGKYFGPMAAMAQDKAPFKADVVAYNASLLDALSRMPWDGFDASTKDVKSATLPAAFTDTAKFKAAQDQFNSAVEKLVAASKGSDTAATKAAIGAVGKTCGGCHDNFRQKP
ncbi:MAG: cytochrome c [Pseudomonadota bacterium]